MLSVSFWAIYLLDLALKCIDKLHVLKWVLIKLLLLRIWFCFIMKRFHVVSSDKNQDVIEAFQIYPTELKETRYVTMNIFRKKYFLF